VDEHSQLLVSRWRAGDQDAARELFYRYSERLIALVRTRLSDKVAPRLDAEDVVQSAYRSFFSGVRNNQYVLERSGDLWRLLVGMTIHKLLRQVEHHRAGRRSVEREQSASKTDDWLGLNAEMLAREPSPDDAVAVLDEVEQLMRGLDARGRRMLEMRLQGFRTTEIANEVQCSDRMVRLVMEEVRDRLSERLRKYEAE
jgi:RNA polymerase sigma-70 factor (ECF subfamily)